jgi:hypothetical protein
MENASREYTYDRVKEMVERQKEKYGWEFIFLGANIDAVGTAARFGIGADRSAKYCADSEGTRLNYEAMHCFMSDIRAGRTVDGEWKEEIERDHKKRGK